VGPAGLVRAEFEDLALAFQLPGSHDVFLGSDARQRVPVTASIPSMRLKHGTAQHPLLPPSERSGIAMRLPLDDRAWRKGPPPPRSRASPLGCQPVTSGASTHFRATHHWPGRAAAVVQRPVAADGRAFPSAARRRTVSRVITVVRAARVLLLAVLALLAISFVMGIGTTSTGPVEKFALLLLIGGCVYAAAKVTAVSEWLAHRLARR